MRLSRLLILALVLCAPSAFVFVACSGGEASNAVQPAAAGRGNQAAVVPVAVGAVIQKSMPIEIRVIGSGEAYSTVAVHAEITGQLTSVSFKEGDDVKEGQVLFTLDRRPLDAALQQAQANLDHDIAQSVLAASQAKRYQDLAHVGFVSRANLQRPRKPVRSGRFKFESRRALYISLLPSGSRRLHRSTRQRNR